MAEHREPSPEKEGRVFLIDLVNKASEAFLSNNKTLDALEGGDVDIETWHRFATQRYLAAMPFDRLLVAGKIKAEDEGDQQLTQVIQSNIQDETGIDEHGQEHTELSHATWRKDFYSALGISEEELALAQMTEGTRAYSEAVQHLTENRKLLNIAGAILVLEGTIPREFAKIRKGRDIRFRDAFIENVADSPETRERKAKARLYLDDHIIHDAKSHYPDLLTALEPHMATPEGRLAIQEGARIITEAKKHFYDQWDKRD